jgi:hypothetical protein
MMETNDIMRIAYLHAELSKLEVLQDSNFRLMAVTRDPDVLREMGEGYEDNKRLIQEIKWQLKELEGV